MVSTHTLSSKHLTLVHYKFLYLHLSPLNLSPSEIISVTESHNEINFQFASAVMLVVEGYWSSGSLIILQYLVVYMSNTGTYIGLTELCALILFSKIILKLANLAIWSSSA